MSPTARLRASRQPSFPRVSGDEPIDPARVTVTIEFSPRERG